MALAIVLIALGIWYLAGKVSLEEIVQAILLAKPGYILLGTAIMLCNRDGESMALAANVQNAR